MTRGTDDLALPELGVGAPVRVLVVGDDLLFGDAIRWSLTKAGMNVLGVTDAEDEAVGISRASEPGVIIVLLRPRDAKGLAMGLRIAETAPSARLVALATEADPDLMAESLEAGFHGFLTRELSMGKFATLVLASIHEPASTPLARGPATRAAELPGPLEVLTSRERAVLDLLADGLSGKEIGQRLSIRHNTVRTHIQSILSKLRVHSRLEAVAMLGTREETANEPNSGGNLYRPRG